MEKKLCVWIYLLKFFIIIKMKYFSKIYFSYRIFLYFCSKKMSHIKSLYHIVIRTYKSLCTINEEHERELYAYIFEICKLKKAKLFRIGGMPDHLHLFVSLPSSIAISKFVQEIKANSSKWLKQNPAFPNFSKWSKEYAAFSYAEKDKNMIINYIKNQKKHHKKKNFCEEYKTLLEENGVEFEEEYFMRD